MGAGAGSDNGPAEAECYPAHLHRAHTSESGLPEVDIDAEAAEPRGRVVRTDPGSQTTQTLHDGREIDLHAGRNVNPEVGSITNLGGGAGGTNQRLGRNAADVKAIAPQELALDQGHLSAQPGSTGGSDQPGRAGT